jgi:predicted nucleic acid-binding Zn ribbon protein
MSNHRQAERSRPVTSDDLKSLGGRNAPVELSELRLEWKRPNTINLSRYHFHGFYRIAAAPLDAYELVDSVPPYLAPRAVLWEDALEELDAMQRARDGRFIGPLEYPRAPIQGLHVKLRDCVVCGHAFVTGDSMGRPLYCSDACQKIATKKPRAPRDSAPRDNATRAAERAARRANRECEHCGQPFTPRRSSGRFCSMRCRVAHHRAPNGELTNAE